MPRKYLPDVRDSILGGGVADRRILVGMGWESISSRSGSARYVMSSFREELKIQNIIALLFVNYIGLVIISNIPEIFLTWDLTSYYSCQKSGYLKKHFQHLKSHLMLTRCSCRRYMSRHYKLELDVRGLKEP